MKVLVTGAGGILGTELRALDGVSAGRAGEAMEVVGLDRAGLDVTDRGRVAEAVAAARPDAVIHAAAWTAVDRAEDEPAAARAVNRDGTRNVAEAAAAAGALTVYVSTDFVFAGEPGVTYAPDAVPEPRGVYALTKREGEEVVESLDGPWLLVRTSWVYGRGGRNFVDAVLERAERGGPLQVVSDQHGRPTWAANLARALLDLTAGGARGHHHVADAGVTTWLGFAQEALRIRGLDVPVEAVSTEAWGAPAPRPRHAVLDTGPTEARLGRSMQPWPEALHAYLTDVPERSVVAGGRDDDPPQGLD